MTRLSVSWKILRAIENSLKTKRVPLFPGQEMLRMDRGVRTFCSVTTKLPQKNNLNRIR